MEQVDSDEQWDVGQQNHADINKGPADLSEVRLQI